MYKESRQPIFKMLSVHEAEACLAMNNFPGQRRYNPLKGRAYADNMMNGTHRRIEVAIARVKETGVDYLMNGQHNCNSILIYGKPYSAVVSYFICDTMEDAWRLFATFDVHASRTEQQFMKSRRGLFTDERLHSIPLRVLQSCGTALYMLGNGTDPQFNIPNTHLKTDKADFVNKFSDEVMFVSQFKEFSHIMVVGAVTAIIATHRKRPRESFDFWDKVATGEMITLSDHRRKLRDSLLDLRFMNEVRGGGSRQRSTFNVCIAWWNSWLKGIPRKSVKINAMNGILKVEG